MKRLLFVDDDPNILEGLQRMLRPMRREWEMRFAAGGSEALDRLADQDCDVVVSDMRMPGMDGAHLLLEVMQRYPHIVRIILSGQSEQEAVLRAIGPAHQYLSKPCDADMLKTTITRMCGLGEILPSPSLQRVVLQIQALPSLPSLYEEFMQAVQAPEASVEQIGNLAARDIGMTARLMQLVNSAFLGAPSRVSKPAAAVHLIGVDMLRSLALSAGVFTRYDEAGLPALCAEALWRHSVQVGLCAKSIAEAEGQDAQIADEAYTAGLLHDAGKLVLAAGIPHQYCEALQLAQTENAPLEAAERRVLGGTHAEVGAYLLGLWGLSDRIVEAVAYHHTPERLTPQFSPLLAVSIANHLVRETDSADSVGASCRFDPDCLASLGLAERLPLWRERWQSREKGKGEREK